MGIFATPDFGATGVIMLFWLIVAAVVLLLTVVGIIFGIKLLGSASSAGKTVGCLLLVVSGLFPVCCYLTPSLLFYQHYGNNPIGSYPSGKIKEGMSFKEVEAILGTPHQRSKLGDRETWIYCIDALDIHWFGVDFGPDGRVIGTYGN